MRVARARVARRRNRPGDFMGLERDADDSGASLGLGLLLQVEGGFGEGFAHAIEGGDTGCAFHVGLAGEDEDLEGLGMGGAGL